MHGTDAKRQQVPEAWGEFQRLAPHGELTSSQVTTTAPSCIRPESTALELVKLFHVNRLRRLLVTDAEIVSTDLVTSGLSTALQRAVVLMIEQGISCLAVLAEGELAGIVTNTELHVILQVLLQTLRQSFLEKPSAAAASNPQS